MYAMTNVTSTVWETDTPRANSSSIEPSIGADDGPIWRGSAVFEVLVTVVAFVLNTGVLLVFICHSHLQTSFTLNIMALLASNVILTVMNFPLDIIGSVYSSWWLSTAACNLYLYGNWVLEGGMMHMHVLITANRIWAMQFPISYKRHHGSTTKTGMLLILLAWIYVHIVCLPGVVLDALYFRKPASSGCGMNDDAQVEWINTAQFLIYDMPVLFIVFAYPFLLCKQLQRQHRSEDRRATIVPTHMQSRVTPTHAQGPAMFPAHHRRKSVFSKETARAFVVLTAVTSSVFICWTPSQIWWTIHLANSRIIMPDIFYKITSALYALQAVLDPVLFVVTFKDLRDVTLNLVKDWFGCAAEQRRRTSIWSLEAAGAPSKPQYSGSP